MCFSIPFKVLKVEDETALIEGNKTIRIGEELSVKKGDYVRIIGDIAVDKLTQKEGLKIRKLIKKLNS